MGAEKHPVLVFAINRDSGLAGRLFRSRDPGVVPFIQLDPSVDHPPADRGWKVRSVGYSVAPAHRGRGIASSAVKALTAFAWTVPTLHRIELYIEPWNSNSIRVAEASGFQRDGLLRSHQEIGNTRRDVLLYATTRP